METPELSHNLHSYYPELRKWRSTKNLQKSSFYKNIEPQLSQLLNYYEVGCYAPPIEKSLIGEGFRGVTWNLERGMCFDGIVDILKNHPTLGKADIFFCPETDLGMARSQNRNISRELAKALQLNYIFVPAYLNLDKGSGMERDVDGENSLGLHGNSIFSRWPIQNPRAIRLMNCKDKMRGREKRLGSQQAVVVDLMLPSGPLRAVTLHLDAHSSQCQRYHQTKTILDFLTKENFKGPTLIGGDWNTSTYHASHVFFTFFSFWRKVAMGPKRVVEKHYNHPERYFEKRLFDLLEKRGFDYKNFNELGKPTIYYHLGDERKNKNLHDWTPKFFQPIVNWSVKKAEGMTSLKLDWFVGQGLKPVPETQKVVGNLLFRGEPVSDHDAIVVDFQI